MILNIIKNVIKIDIRIALISSFAWTILSPYIANLKGLLSINIISVFMILGSISMEFLTFLNKKTNFTSALKFIILYDIVFVFVLILSWVFFNKKDFIFTIMIFMLPYWPLIVNYENKLRAFIGDRYHKRFTENLLTKTEILINRVELLALGITTLLSSIIDNPKYIIYLFIILGILQDLYSIWAYKKYYIKVEQ